MNRAAIIACVGALAAACGDDPFGPLSEQANEAVRTDRDRYVAARVPGSSAPFDQYEFTLVATFTNPTAATLYLGRCYPDSPGPMYGIELVQPENPDGAAYDAAWACVGHQRQFAIPPGRSRVDTLRVRGPGSWDGATHDHLGVLEGLFRILYVVRTEPGDGAPAAPREVRASNVFEVRLDR